MQKLNVETFEELPGCFPKQLHVTFLLQVDKHSNFPYPHQHLRICLFFLLQPP